MIDSYNLGRSPLFNYLLSRFERINYWNDLSKQLWYIKFTALNNTLSFFFPSSSSSFPPSRFLSHLGTFITGRNDTRTRGSWLKSNAHSLVSRTTIKTFPIKRRLNEKIILLAEATCNIQPGWYSERRVIIAALLFHSIVFPHQAGEDIRRSSKIRCCCFHGGTKRRGKRGGRGRHQGNVAQQDDTEH